MKNLVALFLWLGIVFTAVGQKKNCDWTVNVNDSLGSYKAMKEYIMHEQVFGNSSAYVFFNIHQQDGIPYLSFKYLRKNKEFVSAECLNKGSRIFLQLDNGKVVTLIHPDIETCGTNIVNDGFYSILLEGNFLFSKGSIEDLKESPISMIRIRFASTTLDLPLKSEFTSELDQQLYTPQTYFKERANCLLN